MGGIVISLIEKRLSRQGIKITFFKAVIKQSTISRLYPGGLDAFQDCYKSTELKVGLVALTFMSLQQVDRFVAAMRAHGIRKGYEVAIANQIDGVVCGCDGIEFVSLERPANSGTLMSFPVWYACADKSCLRIKGVN